MSQTRMVGKDVYPRPNNEGYEEEVQEVQDAESHWEPLVDRRLEVALPRIGQDELLHRRIGA